ncbi:helix-turn-helix domain-containing protein [Streptomyces sp. NPDC008092]|uniref:helix-turn-helix domain-containing protein n=1 Tax=Streptomyces sp. NPDC008092 TaxID=3364808 RepID=UPI0036E3C950
MPRWKALPESTDPRIRRLVVELRRLKDHSGLSMAALASRTGLSKSSWERYLNGRVTPPRHAVEIMADVCGGDRIGLAALWEVATSGTAPGLTAPAAAPGASPAPGVSPAPAVLPAPTVLPVPASAPASASREPEQPEILEAVPEEPRESPVQDGRTEPGGPADGRPDVERPDTGRADTGRADSGRPDTGQLDIGGSDIGGSDSGRPDTGPREASRTPRRRRPAATVAGVAVVAAALAVVAAVAVAITWPGSPSAEPEPRAATATTKVPTSTYSAETFPCYFTLHDGLLYAGHSTTVTDEYHVGITVEAVAEVQCLVRRHGFDPKGIDGSFGPHTRAAVQGFQRSRGLTADGIVGPMTWRELRKPGD